MFFENASSHCIPSPKPGFFGFPSEAEGKRLVNTAKVSSTRVIAASQSINQRRRYSLLGAAKRFLTDANITAARSKNPHRTRHCHSYRHANAKNVSISLSENPLDSKAAIVDVQTCGCGWSCPVCFERLALEKGLDIANALAYFEAQKLTPILIALTARHSNEMSLKETETALSRAYGRFTSGRVWRRLKKKFKIKHYIANRDTTYGDRHGWHPHRHMCMALDLVEGAKSDIEEDFNKELTTWWLECLEKEGLTATRKHGLYVSTHENASSEYLSKQGITIDKKGKLQFEMTSSNTKNSRTVWDCLMLAEMGSHKNKMLYLEYVQHMTGKAWITFSHGLKDLVRHWLGTKPAKEGPPGDNRMIKWLEIGDYWWFIVKISNGYARLVDCAAKTRSIDQVKELLHDLRHECYLNGLLWRNQAIEFLPLHDPHMVRLHENWINTGDA